MQATVCNNMEGTVGNNMVDKHRTNKPAVDARPTSYHNVAHSTTTLHDIANKTRQLRVGFHLLALFLGWCVYIHKRQPDIRLRHNQRYGTIYLYTNRQQTVLHYADSLAYGVACRAHYVGIMVAGIIDIKLVDKIEHQARWTPSVHRKEEAYALVIGKSIAKTLVGTVGLVVRKHSLGNVYKAVACSCRHLLGSPKCIACSREIEYHIYVIKENGQKRCVPARYD